VHTAREVTANGPDVIIKSKKEKKRTVIDVAIPADRNVTPKEAARKLKYKEFMCKDTTHVEREIYDYTSGNWSHPNSNKRFKEKFGSHTRKTFSRFTTKDSYTWDITRHTESTAV
jgi:hypothetical protein